MSVNEQRILIAGGGIAGLEALLGLRHVLGPSADVEMIAPGPEFVLRPLQIGEPFGHGPAMHLDLEEIAREQGSRFRRAALAEVDPATQSARTDDGEAIRYEALLVAIGTRSIESVPGATHFGMAEAGADFAQVLADADAGDADRIAFVAPPGAKWTLPIYELALLTAAHLSESGNEATDVTVVTHESEPLDVFGGTAPPAILRELLSEAGVELRVGSAASRFASGRLHLAEGDALPASHVVALPHLEVPRLPGIPQRHAGFIPTDVRMNVEGMMHGWAAGDATWFPIKQGGLAAQQADVAVAAIASHLGLPAPSLSYRPVLRGTLLTGVLPRHFRSRLWGTPGAEASHDTLWWPPGKLAGRYLTPYLAQRGPSVGDPPALADLDQPAAKHDGLSERDQIEGVQFSLAAADADARAGDLRGALEWLRVVEEISIVLPPPWPQRRREWLSALGEADSQPEEAAL